MLCSSFFVCDEPLESLREEAAQTSLVSRSFENNLSDESTKSASGTEPSKVVTKKYAGICHNFSDQQNFCNQFDNLMTIYGNEYGYTKHKFWSSGYSDKSLCDQQDKLVDVAHPGVFLERYRKFENEPNNPQNGLDDNENATIVIFSGHGHSAVINGSTLWFYALGPQNYFLLEPNETRYSYPPCFKTSEGNVRCRHLFINPSIFDSERELVKMGCSSTQEGEGCVPSSGKTRWLILSSCLGLFLPENEHPLLRAWKVWARPELNGGYRAILGFSGKSIGSCSKERVADLLYSNFELESPLYWSWLTAMDGCVRKVEGTDVDIEWSGKCVMLAKGNSPVNATNNLRLDTFRMYGDVPLVQPDERGNWYTALAIRDCAVQPPKLGSHYHYEVGLHKIDIHMPDIATAKIYSVDNSAPSELSMRIQAFFLALLFGFSLSDALDAFSTTLESDENAGVLTIAEQAKYVYYYKSGFWEFINVKALSESEKCPAFEITDQMRNELKKEAEVVALNMVRRYIDMDGRKIETPEEKPILFFRFLDPDNSNNDNPRYEPYSPWNVFMIRFRINIDDISEIGPIGYVEIHIRLEEWNPPKPPVFKPIAIMKRFRNIEPAPIAEIELPTLNELEAVAESVRVEHCILGCPCSIDLQLGYYESNAWTYQQHLVPTIMINYLASPTKGELPEKADRIITPLYPRR